MALIISRQAIQACLAGAESAYPYEFMALLEGEKMKNGDVLIERIVIPPGILLDEGSASWDTWMLPSTIGHLGTFHSHPHASASPSRQDLRTSSKEGGLHLILGWPFMLKNLAAYDSQGKQIKFEIK